MVHVLSTFGECLKQFCAPRRRRRESRNLSERHLGKTMFVKERVDVISVTIKMQSLAEVNLNVDTAVCCALHHSSRRAEKDRKSLEWQDYGVHIVLKTSGLSYLKTKVIKSKSESLQSMRIHYVHPNSQARYNYAFSRLITRLRSIEQSLESDEK